MKTILYIEDDKDDQEIFCEVVGKLDGSITCYTANDGQEGLNLLETMEKLPDIIFLDINMPRMNGHEFLRERNKESRLKDIPVIMYSTSITKRVADELTSLGAIALVVKGNSIDEVEEALSAYISK